MPQHGTRLGDATRLRRRPVGWEIPQGGRGAESCRVRMASLLGAQSTRQTTGFSAGAVFGRPFRVGWLEPAGSALRPRPRIWE
jgi:hypothetical protein